MAVITNGGTTMLSNTNLSVRVNGIVISSLKIRRELRNGAYTGRNEIVIHDPMLGSLPLDNDFEIEIKNLELAPDQREWKRQSVEDLYESLVNVGAVPKI